MSVSNGQLANQTSFNQAFWSKNTATTGVAVYRLANTDSASGDPVDSMQREFNAIHSFIGGALDQAKTYKPSWASDSIGSANDDIKTRVEEIQQVALDNQTAIANSTTWTAYTLDFSDFSDPSSGTTIELETLDGGDVIDGVVVKHTVSFVGGSATGVNVSIGPSGDVSRYVNSFDVNRAVAASAFEAVQLLEVPNFAATTVLAIRAVCLGDDLDNLTGGSLNVYLRRGNLL